MDRRQILKVENAVYTRKNEISPECHNVACGQAVNTFEKIYDRIQNKKPVIRFIKKQLKNTREAVVKDAKKFITNHQITV